MRNLFTVGPVNMFERTLKIAAQPVPYFRNDEFSQTVLNINDSVKRLQNAPLGAEVVLLTASGTGAMEACVANLCDETTRALVVNGGTFGARFASLCRAYRAQTDEIAVPFERDLDEDLIAPYAKRRYDAIFVNVHETSIGKLYDLSLLKTLARQTGALLVVDAISSFLADPYDMSASGADVTIVSSQKGLALDAGLSVITISSAAARRMQEIGYRGVYLNLPAYFADAHRGQTPFTPAVGTVLQLADRLQGIEEQGLESEIERCAGFAERFRKGVREARLPYEIPQYRLSSCLTPLVCPRGNAKATVRALIARCDYHMTPNGGASADTMFRVGHIGRHETSDYDTLIDQLREI